MVAIGIKSFIGIVIYIAINIGIWVVIEETLVEKGATTLNKILIINCYLFPIILVVWEIKRLRFWTVKRKAEIKEARQRHLTYAENMEKAANIVKSKELGTITG